MRLLATSPMTPSRAALALLALALLAHLVVPLATPAMAQDAPPRAPLGLSVPVDAAPAAPSQTAAQAGTGDRLWAWMMAKQAQYKQSLSAAVRELKTGNPWTAIALISGLAFLYGVLHAAGPGHGKAVISSYVLANEKTLRRGIMLSFLAALIQALSAITFVAVLALVLKATSMTIRSAEAWSETLSWAFVALIGAWLLWRQVRLLWPSTAAAASTTTASADTHRHQHAVTQAHARHDHAHDHVRHDCCADHGPGHVHHDACAHGHAHAHAQNDVAGTSAHARLGHADAASVGNAAHAPAPAQGDHATAHNVPAHHVHGADCGCGHAHAPSAHQLQGEMSPMKALAIAFAIGIRPCTGALALLFLTLTQGLLWAGIVGTFAMALGTALTVSVMACLAIGSREFANRMAGAGSRWGTRIETAAGLTGSALVLLMGTAFFIGSLQSPPPL